MRIDMPHVGNAEKREEGVLKNGFKSGPWTGWDKEGKKKYIGEYERGKAHGKWTGYYPNGNKKYEGKYELGLLLMREVVSIMSRAVLLQPTPPILCILRWLN